MLKRRIVGSVGLCMALAALALGCSSGGESSGSDAASSVATSDRLLATFDTGYGQVTFVEAKLPSGEFFVAVSETSPIGYGRTPVEAAQEGHTSLELFMALLPTQEVTESLIQSHKSEAKALGRKNADIVAAIYDANAPIEKDLSTDCRDAVLPPYSSGCEVYHYANKWRSLDRSGGTSAAPVSYYIWDANGNPTATTNRVTLGICNDSNVSIQGRLNVKYTGIGSSGAWSPFSYTAISAGAKWRWLKRSYNNYPPCTPDPEGVCLSLYPYPSYYRVDAYGPAGKIFHMTSGIYVVDQDNCVVK